MAKLAKSPKGQNVIHYPHRAGPVCAVKPTPTDARSYSDDLDKVTCPVCWEYQSDSRDATVALQKQTAAAAKAKKDAPTEQE